MNHASSMKPSIPAEPGTKLMLHLDGVSEQIKCVLVGVEPGSSLIVQLPVTLGESWMLDESCNCVVRFVSHGTVYGFSSYVQGKYMRHPLRFLFLAFPGNLETVNLRSSRRIPCHLPAKLVVDGKNHDGVLVDIGSGGASFMHKALESGTGSPPEPPTVYLGMEVSLICALWGLPGEQKIRCEVRNFNINSSTLAVGMSFGDAQEKIISCIEEYVAKVQNVMVSDDCAQNGPARDPEFCD